MSLANYLDTLSVQGSGILDLRYFELGIKASSRVFLELSDRGKEARAQLADRQYTVAGEISRYYSSPLGPYGRLGLELAHFFPENKQWAHLAVDTGFRETPSLPWSLEIAIHMFFSLQGNQRFLVASNRTAKEIGRWETSALKVGGFFSWVNRMREVGRPGNQPSASFEHMLFSLGPYAELKSGAGQLALSLPLRLWLDKEIFQRAGNDVTSYPSELTQDLTLVWSVFF